MELAGLSTSLHIKMLAGHAKTTKRPILLFPPAYFYRLFLRPMYSTQNFLIKKKSQCCRVLGFARTRVLDWMTRFIDSLCMQLGTTHN
jgi:hypothetical protein